MIKLHTIPYNFIIRNCMEPSRRLFFISLGAADFVTYDSHEVSFPTPLCQENVIIWKQTSYDRVGRCFLRSRNQDRALRDWKGGPDPVFPLLFHENPAVSRIPHPASRIPHPAIFFFFFFIAFPNSSFVCGFFQKKPPGFSVGSAAWYVFVKVSYVIFYHFGGPPLQLLNYPWNDVWDFLK